MTEPVERVPPRVAIVVVAATGLVAAVVVAVSLLAFLVAVAGVLALVAGAARGEGGEVSIGGALLGVAALVAGARGAPALFVLGGAVAAVLAWDAGWTAVDLGAQLGRDARVERALGGHLLATALVGLLLVASGATVYRIAAGGQPVAALLALLVAAVLVAVALD